MPPGLAVATANSYLNVLRNIAFPGFATVFVKLHVGNPGADGTASPSAVTTRNQITWNAPASGQMTLASVGSFTMTATETITHVSLWSASTAGTFIESWALTSAQSVTSTSTLSFAQFTLGAAPVASVTDTGTPTGNPGPTSMTAVTQPGGSILLTWAAVPGASSYKLYELRSPGGVSGAEALTGTTTTRSPGGAGTYEYWVTALVGGVQSDQSPHASADLPYTGGGGGGGASPASILGIGTASNLSHWNLGIGYDTGHVDIAQSDLVGGFTDDPYFKANTAGDGVQFQVFMNGKQTNPPTPTGGTHYARSELREYKADGVTKAAWTANTTSSHTMVYRFRMLHIQPKKPWVTVGQIHDASSDALSIKVKGTTTSGLSVVATLYDSDQSPALIPTYTIGDAYTIKVEVSNGTLKIYVDNVVKLTSTALKNKSGCYFKTGIYPQSHDDYGGYELPTEYCRADLIGPVTVTHSPAL